jgi:hypothetical protein
MSFYHHPEDRLRNKHPMMFHSSAFAIGAGVVAVGAAAGSAAISMSAADRAKKAQGKSSKQYKKQLQNATNKYNQQLEAATKQYTQQQDQVKSAIEKINPNINVPEFNLQNATLESINAANQITANTLRQLDTIVPGSSQARAQAMQSLGQWENNLNQQYRGLQANQGLIDQQRDVVGSMLRGELTPVQQEQINRAIAERGGAGFNPATAGRAGGFQTAQAQLADQLRQSSEARILAGMQLAPGVNEQQRGLAASSLGLSEGFRGLQSTAQNWQQLAKSFTQNVPEIMGIGLQGRGQDIQVQQYGIQNALNQQNYLSQINQGNYGALTGQAQSMYGALTGQAQNVYGANKENIASSYAAQQAVGQGVSNIGQATSGALMGYSNALGQLGAAQGAGAGTSGLNTATGFYGTGAQAAQAYGVPVSQIQYYQPTKGAGGYYYNT